MVFNLDSCFSFGKHAGQTIKEILNYNTSGINYINFLLNKQIIELDNEALHELICKTINHIYKSYYNEKKIIKNAIEQTINNFLKDV